MTLLQQRAPQRSSNVVELIRTLRGQTGKLKQTFTGELVQGWITYTE